MADLVRFGVSLEKELLASFDAHIKRKKYGNRSEAFRDLIREDIVKKEWLGGREVAGAITLVYDHHKHDLTDKLTHIQHDFQDVIISTQHVHLDHHNCLETIAVKGKAKRLVELADRLVALKGIKHGKLVMSIVSGK